MSEPTIKIEISADGDRKVFRKTVEKYVDETMAEFQRRVAATIDRAWDRTRGTEE